MRCPKCQYISFDSGDRCRNCGYEFSLTSDSREIDLPIQTGDEPIGPLGDFALEVDSRRTDNASALAEPISPAPRPITSSFDLPLFKERKTTGDAPLVTPATVPRAPLAVRRSNPGAARPSTRPAIDEPVLDLEPPDPVRRQDPRPRVTTPAATVDVDADTPAALLGPRLLAALVDTAILLAIAWIVLYLTLKICGLPFSRLDVLPMAPFLSFLLLIAGGYLTLFTAAGGQTIGKMATGIRVVSMDQDLVRVPLGHAILRAVAYFVSALPAGLGFLPALVGADRRTIHDRLADTRVVKA
jgi:uncharacterized RDD family membrane protein YckC